MTHRKCLERLSTYRRIFVLPHSSCWRLTWIASRWRRFARLIPGIRVQRQIADGDIIAARFHALADADSVNGILRECVGCRVGCR